MAQVYYPDKEEFIRQSKQGNLVPVYREILADMETPVSAFRKIESGDYSFLLESVEGGERMARFSFLGSGASVIMRSKGRTVEVTDSSGGERIELKDGQDPLDVLKRLMAQYRFVPNPDLPRFCGGAVGYIGYDMVRFFEDLPDKTEDDLNMDDCVFLITDTLLIFDHVKHRLKVLCNAHVNGDAGAAYDAAIRKIDDLVYRMKQDVPSNNDERDPSTTGPKPITPNFTKGEFEEAVLACKEYIAAGDVIQVVLSQRLSAPVSAEPFDVYRALRSVNPSPYMYYLSYGDVKLIGSSPEILATEERGNVRVRPIAGTRPRGKTEEEDRQLEEELLADEKERAEHIMLVDLGRNDIGRVCRHGSVDVNELMTIERYSHVMHIVSNVQGRLMPSKDQFDVLRATFPAGTVSGAPKIRAMEIIEELEPTKRASYAGAIGYFSFSGDMDTCITIRTILIQNGTAYVQAGAGIVADSVPENEYQETMNKARAMIRALEMAESGLE
ncbi:MAG: anthranilate synthase component I [Armatimonadota bacterium]|nr:anthranilate synthase component I [Armatimonadota bacterium]